MIRDYERGSLRWKRFMRITCGGILTGLGVALVVAIPIIVVVR